MILQALAGYYERLLEQPDSGLAPYGYSPEKISYEILLKADGSVAAVNATLDTSGKKPQPKLITVPQPEKRTAGIKSNFLWDKTSYVLGVSSTSKRADKEHEAFKALHLPLLAGATDTGLIALRQFLEQWQPEQFQPPMFTEDMKDTNVVFRLDGENRFLHDRPAAKALRAQLLQAGDAPADHSQAEDLDTGKAAKKKASTSAPPALGTCLVTGTPIHAARLHPVIKGVYGAQSSGASIVSFNQNAFTSYGKDQGDNSPVSEQAAFAYTTALNHLLRRENNRRIQIGDASVVFWAEAGSKEAADAAESLALGLFDPPDDSQESQRILEVLQVVRKGRPLDEARLTPHLDPATRMYVLGLAPNASRLSVRFWLVDSLQHLVEKLAQHEADMRIEPAPWKTAPAVRRLVLATVPNREGAMPKSEDAISLLIGETMRAILTGGAYPLSLLANTVMRIRTDGNLSGLRAAICKGVLTRQRRLLQHTSKEEIPVSLDTHSTEPGYLLGRLFATLEYAQRSALGSQVNATIRDRYYGAASATPAGIFPVLLRNAQNHLAKIRKEKKGQAVNIEKLLGDIMAGLPDHFPRTLNIEGQGRFAIGYYHQYKAQFAKRDDAANADADTDTDTATEAGEQE